jgi:hypothetical protein
MNEELEKYVDLLMSMSVDFKMGNLSKETYLNNLKMLVTCIDSKFVLQ